MRNTAFTVLYCLAAFIGVNMSSTASAQTSSETPSVHVLLVHGAWADGSSWSKVISLLQAKGISAVAVQIPLTSLSGDVATVKRAIALQNGPVVLAGHSYGGAVITEADSEGYLSISPKGFAEDFAQDLPEKEVKVLWATQGPTNAAAFGATITNAAWKTKPSWFVVAAEDRAIPPALEKAEAERMKATTITLASSHLAMLSHPKEVAEMIEKATMVAAKR